MLEINPNIPNIVKIMTNIRLSKYALPNSGFLKIIVKNQSKFPIR